MNTPTGAPQRPLRDALIEDHDQIEALLDRILLDEPPGGEAKQAERWLECATLVREHLDIEEMLLLPAFELSQPVIGQALRADHTNIRLLCAEIGIAFDMRGQREIGIMALRRLLRRHHRREAMAMYKWGMDDSGASLSEGLRGILMPNGG